jgi:hypothetical protein
MPVDQLQAGVLEQLGILNVLTAATVQEKRQTETEQNATCAKQASLRKRLTEGHSRLQEMEKPR